jgi:adenylate cyclase
MRRLQHDMRTPLGQILGYGEMLEEELRERDLLDLVPDLEHIRDAANTLLHLVDGIFRPEDIASKAAKETDNQVENIDNKPRVARAGASGSLLVVDDEPSNGDLLARMLVHAGYEVAVARSGRLALNMMDAQDFDLVLLDVIMPEMDGIQTLQAIRRSHPVAVLPVIMTTALSGSHEMVEALGCGANDYVTKPFDTAVVLARIQTQLALREASREVVTLARQLEIRNAFLRKTFERYLSDDIVSNLLEGEEGLEMRGERRRVSVLVADLRGFSTLTEILEPAELVAILNTYLGTMAEVILNHQGTIDEFIGDAILALFGAFEAHEEDAERAVACAIAMQNAIVDVNEANRERGLPEVQMGVGIATGDAIVGNIGSERRTKYGAVGRTVNLATRIETYTLGGEILISPATFEDVHHHIDFDKVRTVRPKGLDTPIEVRRVTAIHGAREIAVPRTSVVFVKLAKPLPVRVTSFTDASEPTELHDGEVVALTATGARLRCDHYLHELADLRIEVVGTSAERGVFHAKVVERDPRQEGVVTIRYSTRYGGFEQLRAQLMERLMDCEPVPPASAMAPASRPQAAL